MPTQIITVQEVICYITRLSVESESIKMHISVNSVWSQLRRNVQWRASTNYTISTFGSTTINWLMLNFISKHA